MISLFNQHMIRLTLTAAVSRHESPVAAPALLDITPLAAPSLSRPRGTNGRHQLVSDGGRGTLCRLGPLRDDQTISRQSSLPTD